MALGDYLTEERVLFLKGKDKRSAFEQLAERLAAGILERPRQARGKTQASPRRKGSSTPVDKDAVLAEIWKREKLLTTRVSSNIAMPHAIIRSLRHSYMAIGVSREGIAYEDTKEDLPIQILVMLVGNEAEHLSILSEVSSKLNNPELCRDLLIAGTPREVYNLLASPVAEETERRSADEGSVSAFTVNHAVKLAGEIGASKIILHGDAIDDPAALRALVGKHDLILVTTSKAHFEGSLPGNQPVVSVPFRGVNRMNQIEVTLLFLLSQGLIGRGERIVSACGVPRSGVIDSIFCTDVDKEFKLYFAFESEVRPDDLDQQVLTRVLQIANDLAVEGREGKPVGTLFVVGDWLHVKNYCQQLIVNPFRGYGEDERNLLDPSLEDTIKEYSRIDGAFIIRGDGVIMSAGTYIKADSPAAHFYSGLGARHAAAATITSMTKSIAIALSESTQKISLFRSGERFLQF